MNSTASKESEQRFQFLKSRFRFIVLLYLVVCLSAIWCNILSFNIAILCTHPHRSLNASVTQEEITSAQENSTHNINVSIPAVINGNGNDEETEVVIKEVIWYTPHDKSLLISAVAVGALVAHFPTVWLINRFGIRVIFGTLGLLSALATGLIPIVARIGLPLFIVARALQGVAFAANFSVVGCFISRWTYYKQSGMFISVLVAFFQLSPAVTMPFGGYICSNYEWSYIYYILGLISLMLFVIFIIGYRNSPSKHPCIGVAELRKIDRGKEVISKGEMKTIPYCEILQTPSVWAIWISALSNFYYENLIFLFAPTYLHAVLGFHVSDTGLTAAIPPLLQFVIKIGSGVASDRIRSVDDLIKVKGFNSIAFFGAAICLCGLVVLDEQYKLTCLTLLSLSTGFLGFTTGGFFKSVPLIARHYSAFVTGNVSITITATMLLVPFTASLLAPDNTVFQWKMIFMSCAVILVTSNVFFLLYGSVTPAIWAYSLSSRPTEISLSTKVTPKTISH